MIERLKPIDGLEFFEEKHWYKFNGKYIPSVSSVIKPISAQVYGEIDPEILRRAAERGTDIHLAIEVYETTGADIASDEIREFFNAYKKFRADNPHLEPIANEYRVCNLGLWYAGTIDVLYMDTRTDKITLVDFKTSASIEYAVVIPQLTGYAVAARLNGIEVNETKVLHLKQNGKYDLVQIEEDFNVFVSCLALQNHIKKYKKGERK